MQLIGGMVLHTGAIAEMKTGEGKTLTATLAVFLNTLAGDSVHLVTVNDYLARRDAEWMGPIYDALGVSVAAIQEDDDHDHAAATPLRRDVTYGTNSEFGFDYLRDNMARSLEHCFQRDHNFAIVDEVDNILIDEARTPLIISGAPEQAAQTLLHVRPPRQAARRASRRRTEAEGARASRRTPPRPTTTTSTTRSTRRSRRPSAASKRAEEFLGVENLYLSEHGTLVNHLIQSLKAESLYRKDKDYAVVDGEVMIIDEFTGRILEGRRWSEGLHQAVEAKEGVAIREENQTLATITLQNYFRFYDKLSGMTGTALTEATEFMKIYKMPVVEVPTNRPMVRDDPNDQIYKTKDGKWKAVLERDRRAPREGPADPRRHRLGRGLGDDLGAAEAARDQARGPQREARVRRSARARRSPRRAARARSRSPPTWPAAASTSSSAATPSMLAEGELTQARRQARRRELRGGSSSGEGRGADRAHARRRATRCASPAGCSSAAPSATSRGGSTTSSAAAPAARAIPARRASSSPPRTT